MNVQEQIEEYIASQPEPKRTDIQALHARLLQVMPGVNYGSWMGDVVQERLAKPMDLLLGRKTFDGWETYWPTHDSEFTTALIDSPDRRLD